MSLDETLPDRFEDVEALEEFMSRPEPGLAADLAAADGDIMILGVGGKMGPTLARLARRAAPERRVVGVARFSEPGLEEKLQGWGIDTIRCDLLERDAVTALPKIPNVIFMAGRKFGTSGNLELTWAMNALVPAIVADVFGDSRIVALSTGNVYPFADVAGGGATEATLPDPMGEYAQSCLGRERMFEYFSGRNGTMGRIIRLNYAIDTRYGVLWDVAVKVLSGEAIDVTTGYANVIWQGDANGRILRSLRHCTAPTSPLNVSGGGAVAIRALARAFGERLGRKVEIAGKESEACWLVNTEQCARLFGPPRVPLEKMIDWVADWVARGLPSLDKPTAYDSRDGSF
ncbi:MAG: epimerase [Rhodospirillales bacterium]|nr:epimerase [Rhodospirillales bacterium]MDP6772657.1 epimerase [Rhodospirillales bacterium]